MLSQNALTAFPTSKRETPTSTSHSSWPKKIPISPTTSSNKSTKKTQKKNNTQTSRTTKTNPTNSQKRPASQPRPFTTFKNTSPYPSNTPWNCPKKRIRTP